MPPLLDIPAAPTTDTADTADTADTNDITATTAGPGRAESAAQARERIARLAWEQHQKHGGATIHPTRGDLAGQPFYAVAAHPERGVVLSGQPTLDDIRRFVHANADLLASGRHAIGTWHNPDDGKTYLDVSAALPEREEAIQMGRRHNQISIWDLAHAREIPTGGTGVWDGVTKGACCPDPVTAPPRRRVRLAKNVAPGAAAGPSLSPNALAAQRVRAVATPQNVRPVIERLHGADAPFDPLAPDGHHWMLDDGTISRRVGGTHADSARRIAMHLGVASPVADVAGLQHAARLLRVGTTPNAVYAHLRTPATDEQVRALRRLAALADAAGKRFLWDSGGGGDDQAERGGIGLAALLQDPLVRGGAGVIKGMSSPPPLRSRSRRRYPSLRLRLTKAVNPHEPLRRIAHPETDLVHPWGEPKRVFVLKGDRTRAGLYVPRHADSPIVYPLKGGPRLGLLPQYHGKAAWAISDRGGFKGTVKKRMRQGDGAALVWVGHKEQALSNPDYLKVYGREIEEALRRGELDPDQVRAAYEVAGRRAGVEGVTGPGDLEPHLNGLSFEARGGLARYLGGSDDPKKPAKARLIHNREVLRGYNEPDYHDLPMGSLVALLHLEHGASAQPRRAHEVAPDLEGHPSFPLILRGENRGDLPHYVPAHELYHQELAHTKPMVANKLRSLETGASQKQLTEADIARLAGITKAARVEGGDDDGGNRSGGRGEEGGRSAAGAPAARHDGAADPRGAGGISRARAGGAGDAPRGGRGRRGAEPAPGGRSGRRPAGDPAPDAAGGRLAAGRLVLTKGAPGSVPPAGASPTGGAPPYFSSLRRTLEQKMPRVATPDQVRGLAASFSPEERHWSGLDAHLAQAGPRVDRDALLAHLDTTTPRIHEVVRGQKGAGAPSLAWENRGESLGHPVPTAEAAGRTYQVFRHGDADFRPGVVSANAAWPRTLGSFPTLEAAQGAAQEHVNQSAGKALATKFGEYKLPGGTNYRERIYQFANNPGETFQYAPHWEESNPLFHLRTTERKTADGKKALHLEEVQSDWHQQGRDKGYKSDLPDTSSLPSDDDFIARNAALKGRLAQRRQELLRGDGITQEQRRTLLENHQFGRIGNPVGDPEHDELLAQYDRNADEVARAREARDRVRSALPDAPFKKNWHELALRRALHEAAASDKDRLTWSTGEQNAGHYGLEKHLDSLSFTPNYNATGRGHGRLEAWKDGRQVVCKNVHVHELPSYLGEEVARRLLNSPLDSDEDMSDEMRSHRLEGLDLKVGGEGMKGFYGSIDPETGQQVHGILGRYANKLAQKLHGGAPGAPQVAISHTVTKRGAPPVAVHSLDITPEMRRRLLEEGVPLWGDRDPTRLAKAILILTARRESLTKGASRVNGEWQNLDAADGSGVLGVWRRQAARSQRGDAAAGALASQPFARYSGAAADTQRGGQSVRRHVLFAPGGADLAETAGSLMHHLVERQGGFHEVPGAAARLHPGARMTARTGDQAASYAGRTAGAAPRLTLPTAEFTLKDGAGALHHFVVHGGDAAQQSRAFLRPTVQTRTAPLARPLGKDALAGRMPREIRPENAPKAYVAPMPKPALPRAPRPREYYTAQFRTLRPRLIEAKPAAAAAATAGAATEAEADAAGFQRRMRRPGGAATTPAAAPPTPAAA